MRRFDNQVVLITGASSGIGKALVFEFARRGAKISAGARSMNQLEEIQSILFSEGKEILTVKTDVSIESDCKNLVQKTIEKFGRIDVLVNNAGISMRALFDELDLDVVKKVMDVNFWGTVYCSKYALPYLLQTKGSLVGVSSIAGYVGLPGRTGYSASKFAMQGLLEVIRIENLKKGLHVLIACPGFTTSNIRNSALAADGSQQGESPRDETKMMSAEEVASRVADAVSNKKRTLILTSQGKLTVLISKFFPAILDKMVYNHMTKEINSPIK